MSTYKTIERSDERLLSSEVFQAERMRARPAGNLGTWREQARDLPIYRKCDVLVMGGGPSGTAAAVAAARLGAEVILLERYNHLGGLSTGGLVIWIDRMTDWDGRLVIRGFAEELIDRLPADAVAGPDRADWGTRDAARSAHWSQRSASYHGVITWSPTVDPERLKLASQEMVLERNVHLVFHCWGAEPLLDGGAVRGAIFESKAGRQAVLARVVVDATGDGDLFARAGAACDYEVAREDIHHCINTAWLFGGVDMARWCDFRGGEPEAFAQFMAGGREKMGLFERPFVSWRNDIAVFMGPRQSGFSGLDPDDQSEVEIRSRRLMVQHLDYYRALAPGFANAYLLQSASQLGVRHTRRLVGMRKIVRGQWPDGTALEDEVGVTPSVSPKFPNISIPYGALVPEKLDGLLACGRHIACDAQSHGFMREIPQCWITGQAAGAAAALAVQRSLEPRAIDIGELQSALLAQGAYLRPRHDATRPATAGAVSG
jgi:2-polyprenyl-6-methoxyphenol hydroxylase-like FAD-dependent oxidoreductase